MRFLARTSAVILGAAVVFALSPYALAENFADCDVPPGGRITCEDHQAAICKVVQGKVDGYCKTPPKGLVGRALSAWVLSLATREDVSPEETTAPRYATILKERRWRSGELVVRFSMPKKEHPLAERER